jgi:hypothetical protein
MLFCEKLFCFGKQETKGHIIADRASSTDHLCAIGILTVNINSCFAYGLLEILTAKNVHTHNYIILIQMTHSYFTGLVVVSSGVNKLLLLRRKFVAIARWNNSAEMTSPLNTTS